MNFIGVDPGKSGAIAVLFAGGNVVYLKNDNTERDIWNFLSSVQSPARAVIEKVAAMPKQGVSSTFKFGQSYGFLRGLLIASGVPFDEVTPAKWQGVMKCRSGGDKNVTKQRAQQIFPHVKITHANADALLLAEFCRITK